MCGNDPPRIDRIFRRSGLNREKWERDDYCDRTISKALEKRTEFYCGAGDFDLVCEPRWAPSESTATEGNGELKQPADTTTANIKLTDIRAAARDPVARAKDGRPYPMTDLGNAERFAARYGNYARYVNGLGWLIWDKTRWRFDDSGEVVRLAAKGVRGILREAAACAEAASTAGDDAVKSKLTDLAESLTKWARSSESRSRLMAMIELAQSLAPIAIRVDDLDRDPWLLNCQAGTIDLRTGIIRPHSQGDLITKLAPVEYKADAQCPVWKAFLQRVFDNNERMIEFVQRAVGYALSAVIREHVIHVLYGSGANGKSTFIETIATMLGDYATAAAPRLLIRRHGEAHPTELVDLREARFVSAIETAEGGAFDEERVKALTGDDRIKARKMRQDFFEFRPTFKLFLATNHRPIVRGDDMGIWRRIRLWPFTVEIPPEEQDHALKEKLRAELAGILAWAVRGCMAWQDDGLSEPAEVTSATEDYRVEQDHFGDWFDSCCLIPGENEDTKTFHCRGGLLYQSYSAFCRSTGTKPLGIWKFSERLLRRPGVVRERGRVTIYTGVKLTDEAFAAAEQQEAGRWRS
jgi:putative DNA primase/helicase